MFQNTRQTVVPLREHRNETSSDTLYTITSIKKMDCSGNVRRSNLKEFFLFLYIDINYITTTREIRNSSFFLYMMNVSNRIKVRKVTQTTGAYINALPTYRCCKCWRLMTSLKKYLFVYNNKDASELGANPRLRDVIDIVFIFVFLFMLFPPQSLLRGFYFIFCFFIDWIWRFKP